MVTSITTSLEITELRHKGVKLLVCDGSNHTGPRSSQPAWSSGLGHRPLLSAMADGTAMKPHSHEASDISPLLRAELQTEVPQAWHQLTSCGCAPGLGPKKFCFPQSAPGRVTNPQCVWEIGPNGDDWPTAFPVAPLREVPPAQQPAVNSGEATTSWKWARFALPASLTSCLASFPLTRVSLGLC